MRLILGLTLAAMTAGLVSCQTAPIKLDSVGEGHWKGRALIRDKDQSRSYIVSLNLNAVKDKRARMDVTSALGTGVASLLVDEKEVRYVLLDSKRYYFGKPAPEVMRPILSIPFDPRWLHNILFEVPLSGKGWKCTSGSGFLQECTDETTKIKITWSNRSGERKTILIDHDRASVQININSFQPKVEDRKNLFQLEPPEGYQKLRVR